MIGALLRPVGFVVIGVAVGVTGVVVGNLNGGSFVFGLLGIFIALFVVAIADIVLGRVRG